MMSLGVVAAGGAGGEEAVDGGAADAAEDAAVAVDEGDTDSDDEDDSSLGGGFDMTSDDDTGDDDSNDDDGGSFLESTSATFAPLLIWGGKKPVECTMRLRGVWPRGGAMPRVAVEWFVGGGKRGKKQPAGEVGGAAGAAPPEGATLLLRRTWLDSTAWDSDDPWDVPGAAVVPAQSGDSKRRSAAAAGAGAGAGGADVEVDAESAPADVDVDAGGDLVIRRWAVSPVSLLLELATSDGRIAPMSYLIVLPPKVTPAAQLYAALWRAAAALEAARSAQTAGAAPPLRCLRLSARSAVTEPPRVARLPQGAPLGSLSVYAAPTLLLDIGEGGSGASGGTAGEAADPASRPPLGQLFVGNLGSALFPVGLSERGIKAVVNLSLSPTFCDEGTEGAAALAAAQLAATSAAGVFTASEADKGRLDSGPHHDVVEGDRGGGGGGGAESQAGGQEVAYLRIDVEDVVGADLATHFERALTFIHTERSKGHGVLVACQAGRSRSCSTCLAYMVRDADMSLAAAYARIRSRRLLTPNRSFAQQLIALEKRCRGSASMVWANDWDGLVPATAAASAASKRGESKCVVQ